MLFRAWTTRWPGKAGNWCLSSVSSENGSDELSLTFAESQRSIRCSESTRTVGTATAAVLLVPLRELHGYYINCGGQERDATQYQGRFSCCGSHVNQEGTCRHFFFTAFRGKPKCLSKGATMRFAWPPHLTTTTSLCVAEIQCPPFYRAFFTRDYGDVLRMDSCRLQNARAIVLSHVQIFLAFCCAGVDF